jgi:hypothetical protein
MFHGLTSTSFVNVSLQLGFKRIKHDLLREDFGVQLASGLGVGDESPLPIPRPARDARTLQPSPIVLPRQVARRSDHIIGPLFVVPIRKHVLMVASR